MRGSHMAATLGFLLTIPVLLSAATPIPSPQGPPTVRSVPNLAPPPFKPPTPVVSRAGPTIRLPDLLVTRLDPVAGVIVVSNTGDGPSVGSELLLRLLCVSGDGSAERCVGGAMLTDGPIPPVVYDRILGGQIHPVPALPAGGTHTIAIPAWSRIVWRDGKYLLAATADIRNTVVERSNVNNERTARFSKP